MSSSIEERIVSMVFDNRKFQSGVNDSISSINKLKNGLNFEGATKGLDTIDASAKKISFNGLADGAESLKLKFSALQVVAVTALSNIANSAIEAGKNLISSLTIDPIMEGYADYGRKLTSIQTIMNATGKSISDVESYFNQLDEYADKTIYNLDDMTSAMAKFTNAGVDLDKSVPAIKGIANMVAVAGQDAGAAQIAFYNLSQSIAGGFLTTTDYKSLNLANVATKEWKDNMIKGAIAAGTLKDAGNGMYQIKGAKEAVTGAALFNEELSKGWATTNVLLDVLGQYGDTNTKIGAKAQAAAQDVKSFSMMMDTLKASVGTTWTDTFEILIGNLDESKTLFTSLTNTISGFVNASAEARNELLQGWKDLGGRTALIDAIKNAFDGVMGVVTSLSSAFRDVFPATTSAQLFAFTEGLKNLTENFKLSDTTLNNLRSTFKGAFAVLDIVKTALLAVGNAIGIMLGGTGNLASALLAITASFGEWLTSLDNAIKQSGVLNKVLTTLAYGIRNGFNGIAFILTSIVTGIGAITSTIGKSINFPGFESFKSLLQLIGDRMTSIGGEVNTMTTTVGGAFAAMGIAVANSKVGEIFKSIYDTVKMVAGAIGTLVNRIAKSISDSLNNADFSGVLDAVAAMSIGGMLLAFKKFMGGLSETLENSKGLFGNITGILDDVRGSFEAYQQNLKAGVLLKIATAIALLSASIVAISLIDSAKLVSSLAAIGTLFAQLLVATKLYTMIGDFKLKVIQSSIVMLAMSTSILILSSAMKNIASLDWNGVAKGAVGITALAGVLVGAAKILSTGSKAMIKGSAGMVVFAAAIKILASACMDLAQLDWSGISKGLVGVGGLMAEISLFLNTAKFSSKSISTALGIVILAGAIKILASACSDFGNLSWSEISKGLTSIGVLLAELSIFSNVTGNAKNVISTGVALVAISGAMKILASAMIDFGSMSWESIAKGLVSMAGALTIISIAVKTLPTDMPITATGLVIMGAALNIIATALINLGGMTWDSIAKGLVTLGGALGIITVALNAMSGTLAGSAALLVAAGALAILAPTLVLMGAMSWESIIKGLVELAGVITIFGVSAALLTPIIPSMLGLAASLALLGVSMLGIGAGLALVGVGIAGVATGFTLLAGVTVTGATAIVAALGIIVTGIAALIPAIMQKIGEGIVAFCKVFADGIPAILDSVTTIIKAILECIVTNIPTIVDGVLQTLSGILDAIIKWIPTISQKVVDIVLTLLKILADNITKFTIAAVDIIVGFIKGITDSLPKIIDSALKLVVTFINGLADAIRNNSNAINDACYNLVTAIVDGIGSFYNKMVDAGIYMVQGFVKGIGNSISSVIEAGKDLGRRALEAAKEALDINSPSKEFEALGMFSGKGYVVGLVNMGKKVSDAAYDMGSSALTTMSNAISGVSDLFSNSVDSQPVIRPVIDLSEAQNGANRLYNMMDSVSGYGIDSSISVANSSAKNAVNRQILSNDTDTNILNQKSTNGASDAITKQPITLQLMLQNGKAIAEYIIDDVDSLMGSKTKITGRMVGI